MSWNAVVFPGRAVSLVPVASKNANSGEIPDERVSFAFSVNAPLVEAQDGRLIATVADLRVVPPAPVQLKEYVVECARAPVLCAPLVDIAPVQPPEAVQVLAADVDHVIIELPPLLIELGVALMVTTGTELDPAAGKSLPGSALGPVLTVRGGPLGASALAAAPEEPQAAMTNAPAHVTASRARPRNELNRKFI
jgi:hypothetical protein